MATVAKLYRYIMSKETWSAASHLLSTSSFTHLVEIDQDFKAILVSSNAPKNISGNYKSCPSTRCGATEHFGTPECNGSYVAAYFKILDSEDKLFLSNIGICAGCCGCLGIEDPHKNKGGSHAKPGTGKYIPRENNDNRNNEQPYSIKIHTVMVGEGDSRQVFPVAGGNIGILEELAAEAELFSSDRSHKLPKDLDSAIKQLNEKEKVMLCKSEGKGRYSPWCSSSIIGKGIQGVGNTHLIDTWYVTKEKMIRCGFGEYLDAVRQSSPEHPILSGHFGLYFDKHLDETAADEEDDSKKLLPQLNDESLPEIEDDSDDNDDPDGPIFLGDSDDSDDEEMMKRKPEGVEKQSAALGRTTKSVKKLPAVGKKRRESKWGKSRRLGYFKEHRDKWYYHKPAFRGIGTIGDSYNKEGMPKILRINDRKYGRYVDIVCTNGTWIDMGLTASGVISERFTHEVHYAEGTYFVIADYGIIVDKP